MMKPFLVLIVFSASLCADTISVRLKGGGPGTVRTVEHAAQLAKGGDRVVIDEGDFVITNAIHWPDGVTVQGTLKRGKLKTRILNRWIMDYEPIGFVPGNSCKFYDMIITNSLPGTNYFQACFGIAHFQGDQAPVNVYVENVVMLGDTDALFINHTNPCQMLFEKCTFGGRWDVFVVRGSGNIGAKNCVMDVKGPSIYKQNDLSRSVCVTGGSATLENCLLRASGSKQSIGISMLDTGTPAATYANSVQINAPELYEKWPPASSNLTLIINGKVIE